jgi:hypothetical protein
VQRVAVAAGDNQLAFRRERRGFHGSYLTRLTMPSKGGMRIFSVYSFILLSLTLMACAKCSN